MLVGMEAILPMDASSPRCNAPPAETLGSPYLSTIFNQKLTVEKINELMDYLSAFVVVTPGSAAASVASPAKKAKKDSQADVLASRIRGAATATSRRPNLHARMSHVPHSQQGNCNGNGQ